MEYKFGIIGLGNIANKFAQTLNALNYKLSAVASRDIDKANEFKNKYQADFAYGSYEELLKNNNVDIVYIASPHGLHYEHLKLCLKYNKHIICEKAFTLNHLQAKEIFELAIKNKCLVMEAMWTRFLPSIKKIKEIIDSEMYGKVLNIDAEFCFYGNQDESYRLRNNELGGGALLDVGIYPVNLAHLLLGNPLEIKAFGNISENNIDLDNDITFIYPNNVTAHLKSSFVYQGNRHSTITLENAIIKLDAFWKCEHFEIIEKDTNKRIIYDLAFDINGFEYQINSFLETLKNKQLTNSIMSNKISIEILKILDNIRKQLGVKYIKE